MSLPAIMRELTDFPECDAPQPGPLPRLRWWERLLCRTPTPASLVWAEPREGREWTPGDVLALLSWLPDDSACHASLQGGRHHRGWGQDRWMRKSTFDAVQSLTVVEMKIAAGKKAGRIKNATPWPTPDEQLREAERRRPKVSVSNLPKLHVSLGSTIQ